MRTIIYKSGKQAEMVLKSFFKNLKNKIYNNITFFNLQTIWNESIKTLQ